MTKLKKLIESLLLENTLSKGSQRVLANKKMVADLADAVRDDVRSNPSVFPAGSKLKFQKASDEDIANWFLENLDKIEREGYEGTVYSRDGVNNEWIARRYIAGSHNWEDLIGVMNMNLRDWYLLKNRNMLDSAHQDLFKFNSVRDVGKYMSTHYHDRLKDVRDAAAAAAIKKMSKTAKIVDNDDYLIYTVLNWAGARTVGLGTQWCTANSQSDLNYKNYSSKAMLFQLFPKNPETVDKEIFGGKRIQGPEKYQFDAGSHSFMDISDQRVPAEYIQEKFPFLYYDLVNGLKMNKEKLQTAIDQMSNDPAMQSSDITRVTPYNIDEEINKLKYFINAKYFTDKKRPATAPTAQDQQQLPQPEQGNPQMENLNSLTQEMLEGILDSLDDYDDDYTLRTGERQKNRPEIKNPEREIDTKKTKDGVEITPGMVLWHRNSSGGLMQVIVKSLEDPYNPRDDKMVLISASPTESGAWGTHTRSLYANKPEEEFLPENKMKNNIDKDVAAMLQSLKKYDMLAESKKPDFLDLDKDGDKTEPMSKAEKDKEKDKEKDDNKHVDESADPEVLSWMKRFSKLGKMG